MGLSGSCAWSCAVSKVIKESGPNVLFGVLCGVLEEELVPGVEEVPEFVFVLPTIGIGEVMVFPSACG
jgi:hypothetical protein